MPVNAAPVVGRPPPLFAAASTEVAGLASTPTAEVEGCGELDPDSDVDGTGLNDELGDVDVLGDTLVLGEVVGEVLGDGVPATPGQACEMLKSAGGAPSPLTFAVASISHKPAGANKYACIPVD